jgi:hypothetical protein
MDKDFIDKIIKYEDTCTNCGKVEDYPSMTQVNWVNLLCNTCIFTHAVTD